MKLAVINDWADPKSAVFWNKDGILRMLQVLRDRDGWQTTFFKKHNRTFTWQHDYIELDFSPDPAKRLLDWKPDAILFFCDFSREILNELKDCGIPMAQCYTGGLFTKYENVADIIFVESKSYVDWMKSRGLNVMQAFGTNTELFKPTNQPKVWDAIFPATFASWKRHWLFSEAMGQKGLVCGWWQENETDVINSCFKFNTCVLHHQLPESLVHLYSMSKTCVITSNTNGGSQRTALEAMACNIPLIGMADSDKITEYLKECGQGEIVEPNVPDIRKAVERLRDTKVNTRDWIMKNYSEYIYADKIKKGIESIL